MSERPSKIWKDLPVATRVRAAEAFWRDGDSPEIESQHIEATLLLAQRLKFRPKALLALPVERRAKQLAQVSDVSDGIATRALIAYHFSEQRPLMGAFLDALGLPHENGLITVEDVAAPTTEALGGAASKVRESFPVDDLELYLRTLSALDGDTWAAAGAVLPLSR